MAKVKTIYPILVLIIFIVLNLPVHAQNPHFRKLSIEFGSGWTNSYGKLDFQSNDIIKQAHQNWFSLQAQLNYYTNKILLSGGYYFINHFNSLYFEPQMYSATQAFGHLGGTGVAPWRLRVNGSYNI